MLAATNYAKTPSLAHPRGVCLAPTAIRAVPAPSTLAPSAMARRGGWALPLLGLCLWPRCPQSALSPTDLDLELGI